MKHLIILITFLLSCVLFANPSEECEHGFTFDGTDCILNCPENYIADGQQCIRKPDFEAPVVLKTPILDNPIPESSFSTLQMSFSVATAVTLGLITYVVHLGKQSQNRIGY